jgi:hypothetical protein
MQTLAFAVSPAESVAASILAEESRAAANDDYETTLGCRAVAEIEEMIMTGAGWSRFVANASDDDFGKFAVIQAQFAGATCEEQRIETTRAHADLFKRVLLEPTKAELRERDEAFAADSDAEAYGYH